MDYKFCYIIFDLQTILKNEINLSSKTFIPDSFKLPKHALGINDSIVKFLSRSFDIQKDLNCSLRLFLFELQTLYFLGYYKFLVHLTKSKRKERKKCSCVWPTRVYWRKATSNTILGCFLRNAPLKIFLLSIQF